MNMEFSLWLESVSTNHFFVDLDQTLVNVTKEKIEVRPGAKDFMNALSKMGKVTILTHGPTVHQTKIARAAGFTCPVIGRDKYSTAKADIPWLIDNERNDQWKTRKKLQALGMSEDSPHFIKIKAYNGGSDTALKAVLAKIKSNQIQPWGSYTKAKQHADANFHTLERKLKSVTGAKVIMDIKSQKSFLNKLSRGKATQEITDVLRGAVLVQTEKQVHETAAKIKQHFELHKVDHKKKPEGPLGYYGAVHIDLIFEGIICEIQVMTEHLWKYKYMAHSIYQQYRGGKTPENMKRLGNWLHKKGNKDI